MPSVTFSVLVDPMVCVTVLGEWPQDVVPDADEEDTTTLNDGGLVRRLLDFQHRSGIGPARVGGFMTLGAYQGFYTPDNAVRVRGWLLRQGARLTN
jgi:hypothetical protein